MTETVDEISNLASILHKNGDKILNGTSKLSVNAALLQRIGCKLGEIAIGGQGNDPFEVLSPIRGHRGTMDQLELIHDFFQKTVGLKVENSANLLQPGDNIDISKFKKLKYLELKRVPVKQIIGLKLVQHQIECIVCERGITALEHLLAECGADKSTGFVWSELKEAVLSFNDIQIVDSSVAFAPRLQVLDLSHNKIFNVEAIERLPNLKYVNLSYNSLTTIPMFNNSARKQMKVLVLKNNFIEDLTGLFRLDQLTELDLSHNLISGFKKFEPLLTMSMLRCLSVAGNPVCVVASHRLGVVRNLHISASFGNFALDGVCLTKRERENVGMGIMKATPINSAPCPVILAEPAPSQSESTRPRNKPGKIRVQVIPNLDGTYGELPPELENIDLPEPPCDHILTKQHIRDTQGTYQDDWLRNQAVLQEILGLPQNASLSSTPLDNLYLDEILKEVNPSPPSNSIVTVATIEPIPQHLHGNEDSFLTCNDDDNASAFFSLNDSQQTDNKETSPDIETIAESDDESCSSRVYAAVKLLYEDSKIRREDVFLSLSDVELREVDVTVGKTLCSWRLKSLESAVIVRGKEVHLVFDTLRRDRRERFYELDDGEAEEFFKICRLEAELKALADIQETSYKCVACSAGFLVEKNSQDAVLACPSCKSKVVVRDDDNLSGNKTPAVKPTAKKHNRSASVGIVPQDSRGSGQEISKCSSQSNIEYAASLNDSSSTAVSTNFYASGRRCDSDIEIISNPSESSIEVIDAPNRNQENDEPPQDEKLLLPHSVAAAVFAGLTESSSSGSITDSVCTAYENSSMVSSGVSKKSGLESSTLIEEPSENFDYPIKDAEEAVQKNRKSVDKDKDLVNYSYSDFSNLDHRLKLFVYANLFEDNWEDCLFLLRCQILTANAATSFDACIVCSNLKIYTLKITGEEIGEEASKFLQKVDNLCFSVATLKSWEVLPWDQGFSVTFQTSTDKFVDFLILLKEMDRTRAFMKFIASYERFFPKCGWNKTPSRNTALRLTGSLAQHAEDPTLLTVTGFIHCRIDQGSSIADGAIIITPSHLFIVDSMKWISNKQKETGSVVPVSSQKLCDLIEARMFDQELILQFINELEEAEIEWQISLATEAVVDYLINQLRKPWEALFSVPLTVSQDYPN